MVFNNLNSTVLRWCCALQSQVGTAKCQILKYYIAAVSFFECLCVCFLYLNKTKIKSSHLNLNYFISNERRSTFTLWMTHVAMESWPVFSSLFSWALNTTRCPSFITIIICHTYLVWSFHNSALSDHIAPRWPSTKVWKQFLVTVIFLCSTGVWHSNVPKLKLTPRQISASATMWGHTRLLICRSVLWAVYGLTGSLNSKGQRTTLTSEIMRRKWIKVWIDWL